MLQSWVLAVVALAYGMLLFGVAWLGDRRQRTGRWLPTHVVFSLALGIYCTSWTFYGAVGRAASNGWDYLTIYLGPIIAFLLLYKLPARIVDIGKRERVTSIADFIAARYGKSQGLAFWVSVVALIAVLPYIALQLRAVSRSYELLAGHSGSAPVAGLAEDTALLIAAVLAVFTILFGTREVDQTERHPGMVLAVAAESAVKLLAFAAVGLFVVFGMFEGPSELLAAARQDPEIMAVYSTANLGAPFLVHTVLALLAILCLPRQFHVMVVENSGPRDLAAARWIFPVYLALFTVFVAPIAVAGMLTSGAGPDADLFVLTVPLSQGRDGLALLGFVGGFSAATAMVIVATVTCSTMLCNEVVMPAIIRLRGGRLPSASALPRLLIFIRRVLIIVILFLAWLCFRLIGAYGALASIGLLSFVAAAQFSPSLLLGLYWKGATRQGALAGLIAGFSLWAYTLLLPAIVRTGWLPETILSEGPLGISWLRPYALLGIEGIEPVTHGTLWSLGVNVAVLVWVSRHARAGLLERRQAGVFAGDAVGRPGGGHREDLLRGSATIGDLRVLAERFVGVAKAQSAFAQHLSERGLDPSDANRADRQTVDFTERLLSGAMGAAAARTVLGSTLRGRELQIEDVADIVGSASETSRFNRDLLETTLENVSEGISVVDADMRVVAWNRRYMELFDYPPGLLRIGTPVEALVRYNARLGRCGPGDVEEIVARRLEFMRSGSSHVFQRVRDDGTVLELRQNPLPGGGLVTSFSDITEHKRTEAALRERERDIRIYTDNVPVLIAYIDKDLRFRFVNRAYEQSVEADGGSIIGRRVDEILGRQRFLAREAHMEKALLGELQRFEVETLDPDGGKRYAEASYIPDRAPDGTVNGFYALFHDVTGRRLAEQALKEAYDTLEQRVEERTHELSVLNERLRRENELRRDIEIALREASEAAHEANQSKTRFLAAASHDLLQPLNAARLFTSALGQRSHDDRTERAIQRVDSSLQAAEELLTSLLDISKLDAGAIEPKVTRFNLREVLEALDMEFGALAEERRLRFDTVPCSLGVVSDRRFLRRILQNFLSNAFRYTREGRVLMGCRRVDGTVRIEVWDTGPGIPEDQQDQVFEEFQRLHRLDETGEKGMGLGLAIVQRMAKALDHPVTVRSWVGRGTVFSVAVPVSETPVAESRARPRRQAGGELQGVVVLCVDNQDDILDGMVDLLGGWGCEVMTAPGTGDAVQVIEDAGRVPDLVLADYHLDGGDTGLATLAAVRERHGEIRGAVITADHSDELRTLVRGAGYTLLKKPVRPAALRAIMSQLLSARTVRTSAN
jgi:PAS domain S-box-containing protein